MSFNLNLSSTTPVIIGILFLIASCSSGGNKNNPVISVDSAELEKDIFTDISHAKQIFYSLPSPLESAMLIKTAGAVYNEKYIESTFQYIQIYH